MRNRNRNEDHTVTVVLRVDTVLYTGRVKEPVKKERTVRMVRAGTGERRRYQRSPLRDRIFLTLSFHSQS